MPSYIFPDSTGGRLTNPPILDNFWGGRLFEHGQRWHTF